MCFFSTNDESIRGLAAVMAVMIQPYATARSASVT